MISGAHPCPLAETTLWTSTLPAGQYLIGLTGTVVLPEGAGLGATAYLNFYVPGPTGAVYSSGPDEQQSALGLNASAPSARYCYFHHIDPGDTVRIYLTEESMPSGGHAAIAYTLSIHPLAEVANG